MAISLPFRFSNFSLKIFFYYIFGIYILEFHSEAGMALAFKVGKQNDLPLEPTNWPKCGSYYSSRDDEFFENTNLNAAFRCFIGNYFLTILTYLSIFISI
jgi:hypothetical protein